MNAETIKEAKKLLDQYAERIETYALEDGNVALIAYWRHGGQKVFTSILEVLKWIEKRRTAIWDEDVVKSKLLSTKKIFSGRIGQLLFSLAGRIDRSTYWLTAISLFVCFLIALAIVQIFAFCLIWPFAVINVKRLHDRNKPGWWVIFFCIPWIGQLWMIIEMGFMQGTTGPNAYGVPFDWKQAGSRNDDQKENSSNTSEKSDNAEQNVSTDPSCVYAEILGLVGTYTVDDIKRAYKKAASQYHPDKVHHLGGRLKDIAEEEMKKINEAYEFFRDKYKF